MTAIAVMSLRGVPKAKTDLLGKKHCALWNEKEKTPKLFREYIPPRTENAFLVSRKEGYGMHTSGCPMTGWISTREFAKVITSIILLPRQPQNTHRGFNESLRHMDLGSRAEAASMGDMSHLSQPLSLQGAPALLAEGKRTWGAPAAPAVPPPLFQGWTSKPSSSICFGVVKTIVFLSCTHTLSNGSQCLGMPTRLRSAQAFFPQQLRKTAVYGLWYTTGNRVVRLLASVTAT